ncbi:MAG TPA: hypothetical protein VEJ84_04495, partial [Acidimicrobiales bacterium]|nr:hypothetical protein [Acidimicrobiales bacterium]
MADTRVPAAGTAQNAAPTGPDEFAQRVDQAETDRDRAQCLVDINAALASAEGAAARARLLVTRAMLYARWWKSREAVDDAVFAASLFDQAGDVSASLEAASLAASYAARTGQLSLATDLATKCWSAAVPLDDASAGRVAHRLGIFCQELFDNDRAAAQFSASLAAFERVGYPPHVFIALYNVASALLG